VDEALQLAWAPKALMYSFGQLAIGVVVVRLLASGRSDAATQVSPSHRLDRVALVVACGLCVAMLLRLAAQTAAAFGTTEAWALENLRVVAIESRWGSGWQLQAAAAVGLLATAMVTRFHRAGAIGFAICAIAFAAAAPLLGHAAGSRERYVLHFAHILVTGLWLGTLSIITISEWPERFRRAPELASGAAIKRFSTIALASASVAAVTGLIASVLYVASWRALWETAYGRTLAVKLLCVGVVGACGWINWRSIRHGRTPQLAVMALESLAALLVLCVTGVLTETEQP